MSSFADPRYVQQRIEKLERELEALKRASVPVLTYQKGPTPGVFNAARIGPGEGQKPSFNMPRLTTILILGFFTGIGWTSSGIIPLLTPIYIRVDGQASSAGGAVIHSNLVGGGGAPTSCSPYQLLTLPQGSYTVRMWWN